MVYGLFGLTDRERRLLEPLRAGASATQLVNRLEHLEYLRVAKFTKMCAPGATILDVTRLQIDVTVISAAMQVTALRARAAWIPERLKMLEYIRSLKKKK